MSKYPKVLIPLIASLSLIGCATSDDRGAATSRAVVDTVAVTAAIVADGLAFQNCEEVNSSAAREACFKRMHDSQAASNTAIKPAAETKFDSLETYKAKRDAEFAKGE